MAPNINVMPRASGVRSDAGGGADSLGYLSLDGLHWAINVEGNGFCTACLSGNYPVPVQLELDKLALEVGESTKKRPS